jgi:hypothetical protein
MFIPNSGSKFLSSRIRIFSIPDPGSRDKKIRIRILIFYLSRIPDPGVKKAPNPGSGSATLLGKAMGIKIRIFLMENTIS